MGGGGGEWVRGSTQRICTGLDRIKVSKAKVQAGPSLNLPCLTRPLTEAYGIAPTQMHMTSTRSGQGGRRKTVCDTQTCP